MKTRILLLLLSGIMITAKAQQTYLDVGNKLTDYPHVIWLKGEPVTHFDPDKIYIIELWATWCGPCIASMPHLDVLYRKFKNRNVVFIGQDIQETDLEKVKAFVTQKGDALSYAVAFSGAAGSDFDEKWIKAAGVREIPQTFIIQNNILVWQTHPSMLNEAVLQLLVDHKFTIPAAKALANSN